MIDTSTADVDQSMRTPIIEKRLLSVFKKGNSEGENFLLWRRENRKE
jgi:hypothetical protein